MVFFLGSEPDEVVVVEVVPEEELPEEESLLEEESLEPLLRRL